MKNIELLAPAKDFTCGAAAIDCGADAVYIGAPRFGAREAAGNSLHDIAELVKHAHKYWARVYVTLNTLLRDEELPQALELVSQLYDAGIDGLIIQDTALLECDLPPVPLIASTQMHNDSPEKVAFLESVGISRVILARELDLEQIREIRERSSVELEFFVHGALCVSYSGQCYLSCALGGRSGNRGQCAQPCRKPYSLVDADGKVLVKDKHLLSLHDLNLSDYLRDLIEVGICSFKIEGRLKDRAYVTNVVSYYRQKLDEVLSEFGLDKSSSGHSRVDFTPDPAKTFNRGYTAYFLDGVNGKVGAIDTPKMVGERVGKVAMVDRRGVTIDTSLALHPGDGICFFDRRGELRGTVINSAQGCMIKPDKPEGIEKGTVIYRNHDHEFLSRLEKAGIERRIEVTLALTETCDGLLLTARDEDSNQAEYNMHCEKVAAEKPEAALANIRKQLARCGGTEFTCAGVEIDLPTPYFLPISVLNDMRRGVLERLTRVRVENRPVARGGAVRNDIPYPQAELTYEGNVLNSHAEDFYRRHGVKSIEPAAEWGMDMRGRRVMTTRYCVKNQLDMCPSNGKTQRLREPLYLVDAEGNRLELRFDCARCRMEIFLARK